MAHYQEEYLPPKKQHQKLANLFEQVTLLAGETSTSPETNIPFSPGTKRQKVNVVTSREISALQQHNDSGPRCFPQKPPFPSRQTGQNSEQVLESTNYRMTEREATYRHGQELQQLHAATFQDQDASDPSSQKEREALQLHSTPTPRIPFTRSSKLVTSFEFVPHRKMFPAPPLRFIGAQPVTAGDASCQQSVSHQFKPDLHAMTEEQFNREDESHLPKHPPKTTLPAGKKRTGRTNKGEFESTTTMDTEKFVALQSNPNSHVMTEEKVKKKVVKTSKSDLTTHPPINTMQAGKQRTPKKNKDSSEHAVRKYTDQSVSHQFTQDLHVMTEEPCNTKEKSDLTTHPPTNTMQAGKKRTPNKNKDSSEHAVRKHTDQSVPHHFPQDLHVTEEQFNRVEESNLAKHPPTNTMEKRTPKEVKDSSEHAVRKYTDRSVPHQVTQDLHVMTEEPCNKEELPKHPPRKKTRGRRKNKGPSQGSATNCAEKSAGHQSNPDVHVITEERFSEEKECHSRSSTTIIDVDLPRVFYDYGKKLDNWKDVARPSLPPDLRKTVEYSGRALEIGRPLNKLMVILVGECGSGKSATLRKLFLASNINTIETKTTIVTEYVKELSVYDESSKIKGKLSFVDVPGFAHNDQLTNDRQLADIVYFREQNTDIAKRQRWCKGRKCVYPNIVLFTLKASDSLLRREKGELLSSLQSLNRCCIVDHYVVNIIIVVTHARFLEKKAKKSTKRMICQTISEAVYEILTIRHVQILFVENKADMNCQNQANTHFCISNYFLTKSVLDQLKANHDHLGVLFWEWYFDGSVRQGDPSVLYHMSAVDLPHSIQDFHSMVKSSRIHPTKINKIISYSKAALETGRPLNKVMIVMAGQSGTGKSETINVLFNEKICKTSTNTSETRKVVEVGKELCVNVESPPVKGILSFVDVPGSSDVDRSKEAMNQAIVRKFREENAGLTSRSGFINKLFAVRENVYPNAVLLVVNATDNRIVGPNSNFQNSLKLLHLNRIVDPLHANLIIVVTHAMSIASKIYCQTYKEKVNIIQEAVVKVLDIHDVPVVFVENCAKDHNVEKENGCDFYRLPNGELSHYNLIQVLIAVFKQNNDVLGRLLCGWYFSDDCPEKKKPVDVIESIGHATVTTSYVEATVETLQGVIGSFQISANETANAFTPKDHETFNNNETKSSQEALHKSNVLIPVPEVTSIIKHKSHETLNHGEKNVYNALVDVSVGNKTKAAVETLKTDIQPAANAIRSTNHDTVSNNKVITVVERLQNVKSDLQPAADVIRPTSHDTVNNNKINTVVERLQKVKSDLQPAANAIPSTSHDTVNNNKVNTVIERLKKVKSYVQPAANVIPSTSHDIVNNNKVNTVVERLQKMKSDVQPAATAIRSTSHDTVNNNKVNTVVERLQKVKSDVQPAANAIPSTSHATVNNNKVNTVVERLQKVKSDLQPAANAIRSTSHDTVNNNKVNTVIERLQKVKSDLQTCVTSAANIVTTTGHETVNINETKLTIETPQFQFQYLGYGYCPKTETRKNVSLCPKKEMKHVHIINKTYSVPMEVQINPQNETCFQLVTKETKKCYEDSRVVGYGIGANVKLIVNVDSHGRWIKDYVSNNAERCLSTLYEVRCASFVLDEPEISIKLKILDAIDHLPHYTKEYSEPFIEFFRKWGTHFITEVYIGGCIKVESSVKVETFTEKLGREISNQVHLSFKGIWNPGNLSGEYKNTHATQQHQDILNEQIIVCGGDQQLLFFKKLEEISPELVSTWQKTVKDEPTELKYSFKLKPYYNLVKGLQRTNLENATLDFLQDDWQDKILKNALQANKEVRRDDVSSVITDEVIDDVKEEVKNGSSCFPSSAEVYTKDGFTSINSFKHGDEVLTVHKITVSSKSMQLGTTEICTYLHFDPHVKAEFLVFHLQNGKTLTVTGEHLLFSYDDGQLKLVSANKIAIGSTLACLNAVDNSNLLGVLEPISVIAISKTILQGVFSPLTLDGTCIVDGVFVSCYACVDSHSVAHASMAPLRWWYNARKALTCFLDTITSVLETPVASRISQRVQNDVCILGIHTYAKLLMSLNHVLPFTFLQQHRND